MGLDLLKQMKRPIGGPLDGGQLAEEGSKVKEKRVFRVW
jgi:hypothetical protein